VIRGAAANPAVGASGGHTIASVRLRLAVIVALPAVLLAGCGGSSTGQKGGSVRLSVKIDSGLHSTHLRFTLRCRPVGGDMTNREALCRMIAEHPEAMLYPPEPRSYCVGGPTIPVVTVRGTLGGREVSTGGMIGCDWPGGESSAAFWAAAERPGDLVFVDARLHCDEDPALLRRPIRWARVRECQATQPRWVVPRSTLPLVLDHSLGTISLFEPKAKIEARFGEGRPLRMRGSRWTYYPRASVAVLYGPSSTGPIAGFLETTSTRYRTDAGLGVGSTLTELHRHCR
jgi:hypothetical protein